MHLSVSPEGYVCMLWHASCAQISNAQVDFISFSQKIFKVSLKVRLQSCTDLGVQFQFMPMAFCMMLNCHRCVGAFITLQISCFQVFLL